MTDRATRAQACPAAALGPVEALLRFDDGPARGLTAIADTNRGRPTTRVLVAVTGDGEAVVVRGWEPGPALRTALRWVTYELAVDIAQAEQIVAEQRQRRLSGPDGQVGPPSLPAGPLVPYRTRRTRPASGL